MIASLFSVDQTGGVGNRGTLPWKHHPEDMAWFKELTLNHVVVMGRKTWDDPAMPHPLPGRINVVVTNRPLDGYRSVRTIGGDSICSRILELQTIYPSKNIWIIGGVNLLMQCIDITDHAYVTHRKGSFYSDTRMHMSDYFKGFRAQSARPSSDKMLNFMTYKNIDPFR
jgi:dihydrofolate reductase